MTIKIKIPHAGSSIKVFVYHVPAWLSGAIIVVILVVEAFRNHLIHL